MKNDEKIIYIAIIGLVLCMGIVFSMGFYYEKFEGSYWECEEYSYKKVIGCEILAYEFGEFTYTKDVSCKEYLDNYMYDTQMYGFIIGYNDIIVEVQDECVRSVLKKS